MVAILAKKVNKDTKLLPDAKNSCYVAQNLTLSAMGQQQTFEQVKVKFGEDKKLLEIYLEAEEETQTFEYNYDEFWFDLQLPDINN